jgi:hypothetical protein
MVLDTLQGASGAHKFPVQDIDPTELPSPHLGALESYFSAIPAIPTVAIPSSVSPGHPSSLRLPH